MSFLQNFSPRILVLALAVVFCFVLVAPTQAAQINPPIAGQSIPDLFAGCAGCVLGAKLRIGQANVGLDFLLPALVGAFLGSTTIKPGRVNVWGTIFGILILAVGISGIQLLGGAFFVEPLFNGVTLVVAIALAAFAQRRRTAVKIAGPPR